MTSTKLSIRDGGFLRYDELSALAMFWRVSNPSLQNMLLGFYNYSVFREKKYQLNAILEANISLGKPNQLSFGDHKSL